MVEAKIYWTDQGTRRIRRAELDGTEVEDLVTGLGNPVGLAMDVGEGKIYWTDASEDKIQRANLDGSEVEDLVTEGLSHPTGLAAGWGRGQDLLDRLGHGQDPTGQSGRLLCRRSCHQRLEQPRGFGAGRG